MENKLEQDIENFKSILTQLGINSESYPEFAALLKSGCSPDEFFDFLASGAYKECYELNDEYVIKFCAADNDTLGELFILEQARKADLSAVFLPTYYMPILSVELPSYHTDGATRNNSYYNYREHHWSYKECPGENLKSVLIQSKITTIADDISWTAISSWKDSVYDPIYDENLNPIPREIIYDLNINIREWIEDVVKYYGKDFLARLSKFSKEYELSDLHSGNLGWINNKPVIIDWLSNSSDY